MSSVFRDDREALHAQNEELRREVEVLRAQQRALMAHVEAQSQPGAAAMPLAWRGVYREGPPPLSDGERVVFGQHRLVATSPGLVVALHLLTFGLYSIVHFGRMHDALPAIERDDPSAAKAIGFNFIPYFNLYWMFVQPLRLADRINLQLRLRGERPVALRDLAVASAITTMLIGLPILWVVSAWQFQKAVNRLVALGPVVPAVATQQADVTGVRIADDAAQPATQQFLTQPVAVDGAVVEAHDDVAQAAERAGR